MKKDHFLRIKLVEHRLEQFRNQIMKVIPQGYLDHSLEYLIRQCALFRFINPSADSDYKVIAFDGMAVVNKIDIREMNLKSCSDFASTFLQKVEKQPQRSEEVRVIFDRYIEESLKSGSRTGR